MMSIFTTTQTSKSQVLGGQFPFPAVSWSCVAYAQDRYQILKQKRYTDSDMLITGARKHCMMVEGMLV